MKEGAVAAGEEEEGPGWPWYRSPYTIGFVFGLVVLTLLRPFTRHEPEPPEATGPTPVIEYRLHGGESWQALGAEGELLVVQLVPPDCDACAQVLEGLATHRARLDRSRGPLGWLTLVVPGAGESEAEVEARLGRLWREYGGEEGRWRFGVLRALPEWSGTGVEGAVASRSPRPSNWTDFLHDGLVWIVDPAGQVRGSYRPVDAEGANEVFHMSFHVLRSLGMEARPDS